MHRTYDALSGERSDFIEIYVVVVVVVHRRNSHPAMSAPNLKGIPIGGSAFRQPSQPRKEGLSFREWRVIFILTVTSFLVLRMRFLQQRTESLKYENVRRKGNSYYSPGIVDPEAGGGEAKERWSIQNPPAHISHAPLLKTMELPPVFHYFANVTHPRTKGEIPYFWSIPASGGGTVQHIIASCLGLTLASDIGAHSGHVSENFLQILWIDGKKYVNVDLSTTEGIGRAKSLGLIESKMDFVMVSAQLYEIASLVDSKQNIRMFTMMRNPVDRAVSYFYWSKMHDKKFSNYSLRDFFLRPEFTGNWVTRTLVNKMTGTLYLEDLDLAKHILKQKCLVGLLTQKAVSMRRFTKYFGWEKLAGVPGSLECEERSMFWGWQNKNDHPFVEEGSEEYQIICARNEFDMELYEYAIEVFEDQGRSLDKEEVVNSISEKIIIVKDESGTVEDISGVIEPFQEEGYGSGNETVVDESQTEIDDEKMEE